MALPLTVLAQEVALQAVVVEVVEVVVVVEEEVVVVVPWRASFSAGTMKAGAPIDWVRVAPTRLEQRRRGWLEALLQGD
jgi:hypothetical protein